MQIYTKQTMTATERRQKDEANAALAQMEANIDYLAMMSGIELGDEDENEETSEEIAEEESVETDETEEDDEDDDLEEDEDEEAEEG